MSADWNGDWIRVLVRASLYFLSAGGVREGSFSLMHCPLHEDPFSSPGHLHVLVNLRDTVVKEHMDLRGPGPV